MKQKLNSQGYYIDISLFIVGKEQLIYMTIESGLVGNIPGFISGNRNRVILLFLV